MINVTKPYLPNFDDYIKMLEGVWSRNWLTNNGPLLNDLELKIKEYLKLDHMLVVNNGTIALQIAIKALGLKGKIITTPFSYVATVSSAVWEGLTPVFVDIDGSSLNIDSSKIEEAITEDTTAILATHVFGNPCDVDKIEEIANKYNLKVIYDAAHAFGVRYKNKSVFEYGDISTTSFHATKLFHTVEGGGVFTKDPNLLKKMSLMRNFGHVSPVEFDGVGINGKNSELHAAMGLLVLNDIEKIIEKRRLLYTHYDTKLKSLIKSSISIASATEYNYSYYPVVLESEEVLLKVLEVLNLNQIFPRRYFYPSLSSLNYVPNTDTPISNNISKRILCLPLYPQMSFEEVDFISRLLLRVQKY